MHKLLYIITKQQLMGDVYYFFRCYVSAPFLAVLFDFYSLLHVMLFLLE